MRRRRIFSSTGVLLLFTMGCYIYVPPSAGSGSLVGEMVRIDVTESEAVRLNLSEVLPKSPTAVEGELVSNDDGTLEVLVKVVDPADSGFRSQEIFQRMRVDRGGIVSVRMREMSRSRTIMALGASAAFVLSVLMAGFTGWAGGSTVPVQTEKEQEVP